MENIEKIKMDILSKYGNLIFKLSPMDFSIDIC
jgi:hypothetical protein